MAAIKHLLTEDLEPLRPPSKAARAASPTREEFNFDHSRSGEPAPSESDWFSNWNEFACEWPEATSGPAWAFDANGGPYGDILAAQEQPWALREVTEPSASTATALNTELDATTSVSDEIVCYGMLHHVAVRLRGNMARLDNDLKVQSEAGASPFTTFAVRQTQDEDPRLLLHMNDEDSCGILNDQSTMALNDVLRYPGIDLECVGRINAIRDIIGKAEKAKDALLRGDINIYGPRSTKEKIGQLLSSKRMYLQTPDSLRSHDMPYENPQMLELPDIDSPASAEPDNPSPEPGTELDSRAVSKQNGDLQTTVDQIYASLTRDKHLDQVEGGKQLRTQLLPHQKKGLDFMLGRENGQVPDAYRLWRRKEVAGDDWFVHSVTGSRLRTQPDERGGGILADEMGMGKTLSILSLIVHTSEDAKQWKTQQGSANMIQRPKCSATLVLVPSELLISGWETEVLQHLDGTLNIMKHHGRKRRKQGGGYERADIVITTYSTLAAEFKAGKSILHEYEWYRVVLDEAHIIRRQATTFHRSVNALRAYARWCLTGTPIQNRLEDIGTLFAWLRIRPFDSLATFRRHIATPFDESEARRKTAISRLSMLLDSTCLRRTKDLLDLPGQRELVRELRLTPAEKAQYDRTQGMMTRAIQQNAGMTDMQSKFGVFQAKLQLRILCNHGTWQDHFTWERRNIVDEDSDWLAYMDSDGTILCSSCRQPMPIIDRSQAHDASSARCAHVLCAECMEAATSQLALRAYPMADAPPCPLCTSVRMLMDRTDQHSRDSRPEVFERYFRSDGHSSKIQALMTDVKQGFERSKSIIFTCWTRTLDLIAWHLARTDISFERIDGSCSFAKRQEILNKFASDDSVSVLIMTTGTGAFGLNLTSANRVFIVEPQWNPSVENQAVARAIRLGQDREVQVIKYLMQGTIEQEMRSLQERKLGLAQMLT